VGVLLSVLADLSRFPLGHPARPVIDGPLLEWMTAGPFVEDVEPPRGPARTFHLRRRLDDGTWQWFVVACTVERNGRVTLRSWRQPDKQGRN
jgi:hypothetical protein